MFADSIQIGGVLGFLVIALIIIALIYLIRRF
jgi:hypothetical protein